MNQVKFNPRRLAISTNQLFHFCSSYLFTYKLMFALNNRCRSTCMFKIDVYRFFLDWKIDRIFPRNIQAFFLLLVSLALKNKVFRNLNCAINMAKKKLISSWKFHAKFHHKNRFSVRRTPLYPAFRVPPAQTQVLFWRKQFSVLVACLFCQNRMEKLHFSSHCRQKLCNSRKKPRASAYAQRNIQRKSVFE